MVVYTADAPDETNGNQLKSFGEMILACEKAINYSTPESLENIETHIFTLKELGYSVKS